MPAPFLSCDAPYPPRRFASRAYQTSCGRIGLSCYGCVLYLRRLKVPRLTQTFGIATATWRELCQGEVGEHVVTGLATPLLDVFDEPLVFAANEIAIFAVEPAG